MTQDFDFATGDVEAVAQRLGALPEAPLTMPKQRLEAPAQGGWIARLLGRPPAVAGSARTSGN